MAKMMLLLTISVLIFALSVWLIVTSHSFEQCLADVDVRSLWIYRTCVGEYVRLQGAEFVIIFTVILAISTPQPLRWEKDRSDHEVLTGLVERVTYQNAENGFCVVRIKARGHRELVTLLAMPPRSRPASGSQPPATGSTTAPTVSSSKPVLSRPPRLHRSRASRSTWPRE